MRTILGQEDAKRQKAIEIEKLDIRKNKKILVDEMIKKNKMIDDNKSFKIEKENKGRKKRKKRGEMSRKDMKFKMAL